MADSTINITNLKHNTTTTLTYHENGKMGTSGSMMKMGSRLVMCIQKKVIIFSIF